MDRALLLHWSYVLGLVGGLLIVVGTVLMSLMMTMMGAMGVQMMPFMGPGWAGWTTAMALWMLLWAAVVGTVALVGAFQIRSTASPLGWGIALVVAGVLSFPVMGGFLIGGLATMASGVLAIAAAAPAPAAPPPAT